MEITTDVDLDIDDVLEEFGTEEILDAIDTDAIRDYLFERHSEYIPDSLSMDEAETVIRDLCSIKGDARFIGKEEAKKVMCELIDDLFYY